LNIAGSEREPVVLIFWEKNIQKQRTVSSGYFKNLERIDHFHERTGKEPVVLSGWFFDFFIML
jgi:hypothetical protein